MLVTRTHDSPGCRSEAIYSDCSLYRYRLTRCWDAGGRRLAFVMLNPSTACEKVNDPTIARCEKRARLLGFGALDVVNLFAYSATEPADLRAADQPVGPENDRFLGRASDAADMILLAWGVHGRHRDRDTEALPLLAARPEKLHTLGLTRHGLPRHPLYVSCACKPARWSADTL